MTTHPVETNEGNPQKPYPPLPLHPLFLSPCRAGLELAGAERAEAGPHRGEACWGRAELARPAGPCGVAPTCRGARGQAGGSLRSRPRTPAEERGRGGGTRPIPPAASGGGPVPRGCMEEKREVR